MIIIFQGVGAAAAHILLGHAMEPDFLEDPPRRVGEYPEENAAVM